MKTSILFIIFLILVSAWHTADQQIRARRVFCEYENTLRPNESIYLNVSGWSGKTLVVQTRWDGKDPRVPSLLEKVFLGDDEVRDKLLELGFNQIENQGRVFKLRSVPKIYPKNKESDPWPVLA